MLCWHDWLHHRVLLRIDQPENVNYLVSVVVYQSSRLVNASQTLSIKKMRERKRDRQIDREKFEKITIHSMKFYDIWMKFDLFSCLTVFNEWLIQKKKKMKRMKNFLECYPLRLFKTHDVNQIHIAFTFRYFAHFLIFISLFSIFPIIRWWMHQKHVKMSEKSWWGKSIIIRSNAEWYLLFTTLNRNVHEYKRHDVNTY